MTVTVGPTELNPTHHIKLTDGTTNVGLILVGPDSRGSYVPQPRAFTRNPSGNTIKFYQGEQKYDDAAPPWTPQAMTDFSGGLGSRIFDDDKARYYWGKRAYTAGGAFEIGPQHTWTTVPNGTMYWPRYKAAGVGISYNYHRLESTNPYYAVKFTPGSTFTPTTINFVCTTQVSGADRPVLSVGIYADDGAAPHSLPGALKGSLTTSIDYFDTSPNRAKEIIAAIASGSLTSTAYNTSYWIVWFLDYSGGKNTAITTTILCASLDSETFDVADGTSLVDDMNFGATMKPFFYLATATSNYKAHYFKHKGSLFTALEFDVASTNLLFINGDQGVATGGSTTTLTAAALGHIAVWITNEAIGSICVLTAGTGSNQPRNFRLITGNSTDAGTGVLTLNFTDAWDVVPDSTTEWAIVASDKWTAVPITTVTWDANTRVTDVLAINQCVYFAHGDAKAMTRMRTYNNAGTWTVVFTEEATASVEAYASKLAAAHDAEGTWIWKAKGGYPAKIAKAPALDGSGTGAVTDLVWEAEISASDTGARVTNMLEYGEYGNLHVMKENDILQVANSSGTDILYRIPISGLPPSEDWRNGRAAVVHNSYLFFSWENTVMRYLNNYVDNIGPNSSDTVMPEEYQGVIRKLVSYPGMLYAAIDGGVEGYSTIMGYNGTGWCNLFTAPAVNKRIQNIFIQAIPGDNVNRLWFDCGGQLAWIPISTNPFSHPQIAYNFYNYSWDAEIEMGRIYAGREKLYKYYRAVEFSIDKNIKPESADGISLPVGYFSARLYYIRKTAYGEYITYKGAYYSGSSTGDEIALGISDLYIRPIIALSEGTNYRPFRMTGLVVDTITREKMRWIDTLTFRVADRDKDLNSDYDDYLDHNLKLTQLETWAEAATVLTMSSVVKQLDGKSVFIDQGGMRLHNHVNDDGTQAYICQLMVYEVA